MKWRKLPYCYRLPIINAWAKHNNMNEEETKEDLESAYWTIVERYITGGPGWYGTLCTAHWDGAPEFVTVFGIEVSEQVLVNSSIVVIKAEVFHNSAEFIG